MFPIFDDLCKTIFLILTSVFCQFFIFKFYDKIHGQKLLKARQNALKSIYRLYATILT